MSAAFMPASNPTMVSIIQCDVVVFSPRSCDRSQMFRCQLGAANSVGSAFVGMASLCMYHPGERAIEFSQK